MPQGGIMGGFMGSTIQKTRKFGQTAGPIGNQFCTYNADESGNNNNGRNGSFFSWLATS